MNLGLDSLPEYAGAVHRSAAPHNASLSLANNPQQYASRWNIMIEIDGRGVAISELIDTGKAKAIRR